MNWNWDVLVSLDRKNRDLAKFFIQKYKETDDPSYAEKALGILEPFSDIPDIKSLMETLKK